MLLTATLAATAARGATTSGWQVVATVGQDPRVTYLLTPVAVTLIVPGEGSGGVIGAVWQR